MKIIVLLPLIFALLSCAPTTPATRIPIDFQAVDFNSISSEYLSRPTFANYTDNQIVIMIKSYRGGYGLAFYKNGISDHINAIKKYLKWEEIAIKNDDLLTKDIASVENGSDTYKYSFHSGNKKHHYLTITPCPPLTWCLSEISQTYDREGAAKFAHLLEKFKNNELEDNSKGTYE